ncbi:MAG TPA: 3-isopropylmalate dehydrogenase [Bacteroidetes bacterium]|nr:3-isopropylmalate dehydrogenase [Bacteroidota bacterium]
MSHNHHIALLPGDGIGREVLDAARCVLERVSEVHGLHFEFSAYAFGGAGIDSLGTPLPEATLTACQEADAILMGAIGGPKWDGLRGADRPESGLLRLRSELGVFANLRPVTVPESLAHLSVLPAEKVAGVDIMVVRELTGGIYFGTPRIQEAHRALDTMVYDVQEIERITRVAGEWATRRSGRIISVDKANVLAVSRLWRETASRIIRDEFPDVKLDHMYVDNAAMQLVLDPHQFDVILTGNLFGDILSDLSSTLAGSLGLLPSASLGGTTPLFEPVHGSAPDLAGLNRANPVAAILSAAMMLDEWDYAEAAASIRSAVSATLKKGLFTADLVLEGSSYQSATVFTDVVLSNLNLSEPVS